MSEKLGVSVVYLSVGSGHRMAAHAIASALQREAPELRVTALDPFSASIRMLPFLLERIQVFSNVIVPRLYDAYWGRRAGGDFLQRLLKLRPFQKMLRKGLGDQKGGVIIATHAFPCLVAVALKKRTGAFDRVYAAITDLGAHAYWPIHGVDGYFVASDAMRSDLIARGLPPEAVHVTGIPLRPAFERAQDYTPDEKGEQLRVLLMAGALQSASYVAIRRHLFDLLDALGESLQGHLALSIITGNNHRLRKKIVEYVGKTGASVHVLGVVEDMCEVLLQHDLLITKPGGLILSEALACGTCLILVGGGPGQERANANWVIAKGAGFQAENVSEVVEVIRRCQQDPELVQGMKKRTKSLGKPDAAAAVARHVLDNMHYLGPF